MADDGSPEAMRAWAATLRATTEAHRVQIESLVVEHRTAVADDPDPIRVRLHEFLAIDRALTEALARNAEAMIRLIEDGLSTEGL